MHGRDPEVESLCNRVIGRPFGSVQQYLRTCHLARRRFAFLDQLEQVVLLIFSKLNKVFVGHKHSSFCYHKLPRNTCQNY